MSIAHILLAAGASTRMRGRDKLMEPVRGHPLIRDRLSILYEPGHGSTDVLVVVPSNKPDRIDAIADMRAKIVINEDADTGMASSIKAALEALPDGSKAALFLPADMPDITANDIDMLRQAHIRNPRAIIRAATADKQPGNPVIFPEAYFQKLMQLQGDQSGRDVIKAHAGHVQLVPLQGTRAATDLDTPQDWADWRAANPSL